MLYDMSKLKGRIIEVCGTLGKFAQAMSWSLAANGRKVSGRVQWTQAEIERACCVLSIEPCDVWSYFFTHKV